MLSSNGLPANCKPMGRPVVVNPQGTLRVGTFARLKVVAKSQGVRLTLPLPSITGSCSSNWAGDPVLGDNKISVLSNSFKTW